MMVAILGIFIIIETYSLFALRGRGINDPRLSEETPDRTPDRAPDCGERTVALNCRMIILGDGEAYGIGTK